MRAITSSSRSTTPLRARAVARSHDQERMLRGVLHGVLLSIAVWVSAGYLAFVLG